MLGGIRFNNLGGVRSVPILQRLKRRRAGKRCLLDAV